MLLPIMAGEITGQGGQQEAVDAARGPRRREVEWPTYAALILCYLLWAAMLQLHATVTPLLTFPVAAYAVALQSSLRHEALHGHPTRKAWLNELLVFPPLCLIVPYRRFRDSHLRHHFDARLTDPYDDPESWYLAARTFAALPRPLRLLLRINNTLAGRLIVGPPLMVFGLVRHDFRLVLQGDARIASAWALHLAGAVPVVIWLVVVCRIPLWSYLLLVSWPALSLLMLRTYAEHQAHPEVAQRTAIIEASPIWSFLFLNNNLHFVHHSRPRAPWYRLPAIYRAERQRFRVENGGYGFDGYGEMVRRHLFRAKEPVAHPFLRR